MTGKYVSRHQGPAVTGGSLYADHGAFVNGILLDNRDRIHIARNQDSRAVRC